MYTSGFLPAAARSIARTGLRPLLLALLGVAALTGGTHALAAGSDRTLPNLALPTLGGSQLWADLALDGGWRVQRHVWTGHARLLDEDNVRRAWGSEAACLAALRDHAKVVEGQGRPVVVLLHGLWRTRRSMSTLAGSFRGAGYEVVDVTYPSARASIEQHAAQVAGLLDRLSGSDREVSFVTHSLGALVTRQLLARKGDAWRSRHRVHRAVFIAPPNQGARLAEIGRKIPLLPWIYGEPMRQIAGGFTRDLAGPGVPFATIAGGCGDDEGWNPLIPGDDDGVVAVAETRLPGAAGELVVRRLHTTIMKDPVAIDAAVKFIRRGALPSSGAAASRAAGH
jgi:pimeloyl-ACP methyl ester carboxylesterase